MSEQAYQHEFISRLQRLLHDYVEPAVCSNPMTRIIWIGFKGQIPPMLLSLDQNEEAIAGFKDKLRWLLEEEPKLAQPVVEVKDAEVQHDG